MRTFVPSDGDEEGGRRGVRERERVRGESISQPISTINTTTTTITDNTT